jgi:pectate lyase
MYVKKVLVSIFSFVLFFLVACLDTNQDSAASTQSLGDISIDAPSEAVAATAGTNNLSGFAKAATGGGVLAETDAAYKKVTTPLELVNAVYSFNKTGAVKVIEIMNDLNLGWNEIGAAAQAVGPFVQHATPKLHPVLITSGVSKLDIKYKNGGLTIFSANGATIKHCTFNIKSTHNIIVRNLKFDEMWEWDEASKGNYDKNDWDFIDIGNGGTTYDIWIDHCTFTKAYDGILDIKAGSYNVTMSWNKYTGDDGATNSNSFVRQQFNALEKSSSSYPMYNWLRTHGFSINDLVTINQGHDKTHLIGSNSLDSANSSFTITNHHEWYINVWDRNPARLRAGNVHVYNFFADDTVGLAARRLRDTRVAAMAAADQVKLNGSSSTSATYHMGVFLNGSISTENGALLVEKSIYQDCLYPLRNNQTDPTDSTYTGKIKAVDTIYHMDNADGTVTEVRGDSANYKSYFGPKEATEIAFSWNGFTSLPYSYIMDDPANLKNILASNAGAGKLTWAKSNWLLTTY